MLSLGGRNFGDIHTQRHFSSGCQTRRENLLPRRRLLRKSKGLTPLANISHVDGSGTVVAPVFAVMITKSVPGAKKEPDDGRRVTLKLDPIDTVPLPETATPLVGLKVPVRVAERI